MASTAVRKPAKGLDSATRIASLTTSGEIRLDSRKTLVDGMSHQWSDVYRNKFDDASVNVVILKIGN